MLRMDVLFDSKLLLGPQSKLNLAAEEGVKLKHLVSAVRALWRSSPTGNHPNVTHLKSMLRPSPQRRRDQDEDDSPVPCDDEGDDRMSSSPEDAGEDQDDACSVLSASTLRLPGRGDAADSDGAMTDRDSEDEEGDHEACEDDIPSSMADKVDDKGDEDIFDESQRDSQRPGAWMGSAIALFNRLEKTGKIVVPVEVLYEWLVDGKPAEKGEYAGSFYIDDLECLPICFQILLFDPPFYLYRRGLLRYHVWMHKKITSLSNAPTLQASQLQGLPLLLCAAVLTSGPLWHHCAPLLPRWLGTVAWCCGWAGRVGT